MDFVSRAALGTHADVSAYATVLRGTGTKMVGGITPKKGGTKHLGLPVFNTVAEVDSARTCPTHPNSLACRA